MLNPKDPLTIARIFVQQHYNHPDGRTLIRHRGQFYAWAGACWAERTEAMLRAEIWTSSGDPSPSSALGWNGSGRTCVWSATFWTQSARSPSCPMSSPAPAWLDRRTEPPAADLLACANGLLHLPTKELIKTTPAFFGVNAVEFAYDPHAPAPTQWLKFLASLWPKDPEAIATLREIFGYALTSDTRQQKIFLMIGPRRSGKGTIARILKALLGKANVAGPTLSGLGMNFGLASLIGKPLAIISDARLSGRADQHAIAERLLSISGEDALDIDRKYLPVWNGTLPARFLIVTNIMPEFRTPAARLPRASSS